MMLSGVKVSRKISEVGPPLQEAKGLHGEDFKFQCMHEVILKYYIYFFKSRQSHAKPFKYQLTPHNTLSKFSNSSEFSSGLDEIKIFFFGHFKTEAR